MKQLRIPVIATHITGWLLFQSLPLVFLLGNGETTLKDRGPSRILAVLFVLHRDFLPAQLCFTATVFSCEEMAVMYVLHWELWSPACSGSRLLKN
jgi:hypothetical protein